MTAEELIHLKFQQEHTNTLPGNRYPTYPEKWTIEAMHEFAAIEAVGFVEFKTKHYYEGFNGWVERGSNAYGRGLSTSELYEKYKQFKKGR